MSNIRSGRNGCDTASQAFPRASEGMSAYKTHTTSAGSTSYFEPKQNLLAEDRIPRRSRSTLDNAVGTMLKNMAGDDAKEEALRDMVKQLCIEELSQREGMLDRLVSELSSKLTRKSGSGLTLEDDSDSATVIDSSAPASPSEPVTPSQRPCLRQNKPYQASVEEVSDIEGPKSCQKTVSSHSSTQSSDCSESESDSDCESGRYSRAPASQPCHRRAPGRQSVSWEDQQPPSHAQSSGKPDATSKPRQAVRFSNRGPPILRTQSYRESYDKDVKERSSYSIPEGYVLESKTDPETSRGSNPAPQVDVKWGKLFLEGCEPTERFRSIVLGLAKYLTSQFSPQQSLVLSPTKMRAFYSKYQGTVELVNYDILFDAASTTSMKSLQMVYERLRCDYHLIPSTSDEGPTFLPALTPLGFQQWFTSLAQAFPSHEAERLAKIVADVQLFLIPAASDSTWNKTEKLPRGLSRTQFPAERHGKVHRLVMDAISEWRIAMGLRLHPRSRPASTNSVPRITGSDLAELSVSRREEDVRTPTLRSPVLEAAAPRDGGPNDRCSYRYVERSTSYEGPSSKERYPVSASQQRYRDDRTTSGHPQRVYLKPEAKSESSKSNSSISSDTKPQLRNPATTPSTYKIVSSSSPSYSTSSSRQYTATKTKRRGDGDSREASPEGNNSNYKLASKSSSRTDRDSRKKSRDTRRDDLRESRGSVVSSGSSARREKSNTRRRRSSS